MVLIPISKDFEELHQILISIGYSVNGTIEDETKVFMKATRDNTTLTVDYLFDSPNRNIIHAYLSGPEKEVEEIERILG